MTKNNELAAIPLELPSDMGELWWDEKTKVSMMADKHIENALLKLQGLGKTRYNATDELRRQWISVLVRERARRMSEAHATKID